jgi:hypothetical protein
LPAFRDLTDLKFGKLTAKSRSHKDKNGHWHWLCECECGEISVVASSDLITSHTQSCGCLALKLLRERKYKKHGLTPKGHHNKLCNVWASIKNRCYNQKAPRYRDYGGRGITVCDEWRASFQLFYEWAMNNGYREGLSIDRENNDKGYDPSNCRWATAKAQANNRRNNIAS